MKINNIANKLLMNLKKGLMKLNKNRKKLVIISIIIMILLASTPLVLNFYIGKVGEKYIYDEDKVPKADAIIVLGAYVKPDGIMSDMLNDRMKCGLKLYESKKAPKLLLSGDHGRVEYDEVNNMRKFLKENNVPDEDIFMDHAGFDTYDSMYRANEIFKVKKAIIVTQNFHLTRAIYTAKKLGIDAYGVSADYQNYRGIKYNYMREILARSKCFMDIVFKSEPTHHGKKIPITGDGRETHDLLD